MTSKGNRKSIQFQSAMGNVLKEGVPLPFLRKRL